MAKWIDFQTLIIILLLFVIFNIYFLKTNEIITLLCSAETTATTSSVNQNYRDISSGQVASKTVVFNIGQRVQGAYTGPASLCFSPYAYYAQNLLPLPSTSPSCDLNANSAAFSYNGQVPTLINDDGTNNLL